MRKRATMGAKARGLGAAAALLGFLAACGSTGGASAPDVRSAPRDARAQMTQPVTAARRAASPAKVERVQVTREGATLALGALDGRPVVYVADEDEHLVRVIDAADDKELSATPLEGRPGQMLVRDDGALVVALRDRGRVVVLAPSGGADEPLAVRASVAVAAEPIGLALGPSDDKLLVASGWGRAVTVLDAHSLAVVAVRRVAREARAIVVTDDGRRALVSHAAAGHLTELDLANDATVLETKLVAGETTFDREGEANKVLGDRHVTQGYALAKTKGALGGRVLMPQVLAFTGDPTIASEGYGGGSERLSPELFNVAVLDADTATPLKASLVLPVDGDNDHNAKREPSRRCLLPRAAVTFGRELFVACLGVDAVVAYDAASLRPRSAERRRFRVAEGPTGLAVDERSRALWVWSQFSRSLTRVDLAAHADGDDTGANVRSFALAHHAPASVDDPVVALGRRLFHTVGDARISHDGRACASCHPDGRDDGLVWSTPNGPRQTPMLAGRTVGTAPYSWQGDTHTVADHLEHTLTRLGGKGLAREEREAIAKYLEVMPTPPASAAAGEDPERVARGAALFASPEVGCASCHGEKGDTPDGLPHDVKSKVAADTAKAFDTPSLKYLGGSAPYFHDGRYADLATMLRATDGKMGHTKQLAKRDVDALEAFLRSL